MTLGWAIITTGLHADVKIAPALNAPPDAELVAVYSRDQGRAEAFAQKHGAKAAYSDLEALLRDCVTHAWRRCSSPRRTPCTQRRRSLRRVQESTYW
jgi:hypothetical protein